MTLSTSLLNSLSLLNPPLYNCLFTSTAKAVPIGVCIIHYTRFPTALIWSVKETICRAVTNTRSRRSLKTLVRISYRAGTHKSPHSKQKLQLAELPVIVEQSTQDSVCSSTTDTAASPPRSKASQQANVEFLLPLIRV